MNSNFTKPENSVSFLFWNVQKQPRLQALSKLVLRYQVDFLAVAEHDDDVLELEDQLSSFDLGDYKFLTTNFSMRRPVHAFAALNAGSWSVASDDASGYVSTYRFEKASTDADEPISWLIACAHCPSQMYGDASRRNMFARSVITDLRSVAEAESLEKLILMGDMNMNPFDEGVAGIVGFNATATRNQARDLTYNLDDCDYPYLYNPMWSRLGDLSPGPPGSLKYTAGSRGINLHWHAFDQVMVSPSLMDHLLDDTVHFVNDTDAIIELSENDAPGGLHGTDHYPLRFCITCEQE